MEKEFIEKSEKLIGRKFGFFIRCDDKNKPKEILNDMYFQLWENEKMSEILSLCESHNLKYDFGLESFNTKIDSMEAEICIVSNNHQNN
jgi:hypothetical protein